MVINEITSRYSVRNFLSKKIDKTALVSLLESARLAPSWLNVQPWHFIVVQNPETKALLSQLANGQPHIISAPAVILCCGDYKAWDEDNFRATVEAKGLSPERVDSLMSNSGIYPKLKGEDILKCRTLEQLTYAIAYMTLQAESLGLGACVIGAFGNELTGMNPEIYCQVKDKLNIPSHLFVMTMLAVGYCDEKSEKPDKQRKDLNEIVSFEKL